MKQLMIRGTGAVALSLVGAGTAGDRQDWDN
ncbi:MAG: hypothetical protein QOJ28_3557, partial [Mycobacterium sp.]|nr:hypothetical protein [Mycobacterium sp.]